MSHSTAKAETEIRDVLQRHFGTLSEESFLSLSIEALDGVSEGMSMRLQELEDERD